MVSPAVRILAVVANIGSMCALMCCKMDKMVPINYILLAIFTVAESIIVGFAVMRVGKPEIVFEAALLTFGIVVALTIYAARTKTDFTICGSLLYTLSMLFFITTIFMVIFGAKLNFFFAAMGVLLFSFYLVYDTQLILAGTMDSHRKFQMDEDSYIMGAMMLYIDII